MNEKHQEEYEGENIVEDEENNPPKLNTGGGVIHRISGFSQVCMWMQVGF